MVLLLTAVLASAPITLEARSVHLLPAAAVETVRERAQFSLSEKLSAPIIGLFSEFVGASIVIASVQGLLLGATAAFDQPTLQLITIPAGVLSTALLGAASAVGIQGWLSRADVDLPLKAMWICGSGSMAIATLLGLGVGFLTGAPLIGMLYGLAVAAVAGPIIQTFVATRSAKVRLTPSGALAF